MEERVAREDCRAVEVEGNAAFAVPGRVDDVDVDSADGDGSSVLDGGRVDGEGVVRVEVVRDVVAFGEFRAAGDVVGVGVRVEDADELGVVVVEYRLVLVDVVGGVEDGGLAVREEDVRAAAFPGASDLDQRPIEVGVDGCVPVNAAPAVHPVEERYGVVPHVLKHVRRGPGDDARGTDRHDLRVLWEGR